MKYELALRLKKAGFPQIGHNQDGYTSTKDGVDIYVPLLEELIESCGDEFMLTNETYNWEAWKGSLSSFVRIGESGAKYQAKGSTPLEAVANLYISIHEKRS